MAVSPRTFRAPGVRGRAASRSHEKALQRRPEWIDVREIPDRMGMSQIDFSVIFGIPVATLRHWESGERKPGIPALVLLHVIARHPHAVIGALKSGALKRRYRQPLRLEAVRPVTQRLPARGLPDEKGQNESAIPTPTGGDDA